MKPVMFCRNRIGHAALAAELDEVRPLHRRFGEEHAVVRDDADRIAVDVREAGDERRAVACLELVKAAPVERAGRLLRGLERRRILRHDAVDLRRS